MHEKYTDRHIEKAQYSADDDDDDDRNGGEDRDGGNKNHSRVEGPGHSRTSPPTDDLNSIVRAMRED